MTKLYYGLLFSLLFFVLSIPASAQEAQQDSAQQTETTAETTEMSDATTDSVTTTDSTTTTTTGLPKIFISEINWAGSELSQADEWLEIYNANGTDVDLGGWILTGCATSGDAVALAHGTVLNAGDTLLVSNYDLGSDKTTLTVQPDLVTASISLSNSAQQIMLVMPDGTVIDAVGDGTEPVAGSTNPKTSMVRNTTTLEWLSATTSVNLSDQTQLGTPGVLGADVSDYTDDAQIVDETQESQDTTTDDQATQETTTGTTVVTEADTDVPTASDNPETCHLILNEFVSNPNDDELEWIEIFNPCHSAIDLTGFTVRDATLKTTAFEQIIIDPNSYAVVADPNGQLNNDGDTIELVDANQFVIDSVVYGDDPAEPKKGYSLALNDQGLWEPTYTQTPESINIIADAPEIDEIVEDQTEAETVAETETPTETAVTDDASDELDQTDETEIPASDTEIQTETETETQSELMSYQVKYIILNEIVSDPSENDVEWIELYNPQTTEVDLTGWTITDASGKSTVLDGLTIAPSGYLVIENPKGKLNNDGDCVTLLDPAQNTIDQIVYGTDELDEPKKGESLAFDGSGWTITSAITKGETNNLIYEEETTQQTTESTDTVATTTNSGSDTKTQQQTVSNSEQTSSGNNSIVSDDIQTHTVVAIAQTPKTSTQTATTTVKSNSVSQATSISGIVTAIPGTFGSQIAFIEGAQLYFYYADWPMLELGDIVSVKGEASESRGEDRIKISDTRDITVIGHVDLEALTISINELSNIKDGTLVTLEGEVQEIQDTKLILKDATGQITVVANAHEGMNWDTVGSRIKITGIVRTVSGEQRLYPRNAQDIEVIQKTTDENEVQTPIAIGNTTDYTPWVGGGLLALSIASFAYYFARHKNLDAIQVGA